MICERDDWDKAELPEKPRFLWLYQLERYRIGLQIELLQYVLAEGGCLRSHVLEWYDPSDALFIIEMKRRDRKKQL